MNSFMTLSRFRTCSTAAALALTALAATTAHAQVFLQVDGFGIGSGSCSVQAPGGPVTDSANVNNLFFPNLGDDTAIVGVGGRGSGYAEIIAAGEIDGPLIRLQGRILPQGSSICDETGCGNGSGGAGVTSRATFRVSEEAVAFLSANMTASSRVDPGQGGGGNSSATTSIALVEIGAGTIFGHTISNSSNSVTTAFFPDGGVGRFFPGIDYSFTVTCSGGAQAFGSNAVADSSAFTIAYVRLLPPTCPSATAPADVVHCTSLAGSPASFSIIASGQQPRTVRWQFLNAGVWTNLTDGAFAGVGVVSGSSTAGLTISGPGIAPNSFRAVVSNNCGNAFSMPASLLICASDFNCDNVVDFFDYLDFVDVFGAGDPIADFNQDGIVDFFDYLDFVDAFGAGC